MKKEFNIVILVLILLFMTIEISADDYIDYQSLLNDLNFSTFTTYNVDGNDQGYLSWGLCYIIESNVYNLKKSYSDEFLIGTRENIDFILSLRDDRRGVESYIDDKLNEVILKTWRGLKYSRIVRNDSMFSCYGDGTSGIEVYSGPEHGIDTKYFAYPDIVLTGRILQSILHFVVNVDSLKKWYVIGGNEYRENLIKNCEESYYEYTKYFVDTTINGDTYCGHWKHIDNLIKDNTIIEQWTLKKFYPQYPFTANSRDAYNKCSTMADAAILLYFLTNDNIYLEQSMKFAHYFKNNLDDSTFNENYVWAYSVKYSYGGGDDISHAGISLSYICDFYKILPDLYFNKTDLSKFCSTLENLVPVKNEYGQIVGIYPYIDGRYHSLNSYFEENSLNSSLFWYYELAAIHDPFLYEILFKYCEDFFNFKPYFEEYYTPFSIELKQYSSSTYKIKIKSLNNYFTSVDTIVYTIVEDYKNDTYVEMPLETIFMSAGDSFIIEKNIAMQNDTTLIDSIFFQSNIDRWIIDGPIFRDSIDIVKIPESLYIFINEREIPVLKNNYIMIWVVSEPINKPIYAIKNAEVKIYNGKDLFQTGYTDASGLLCLPVITNCVKSISVNVQHEDYYSKTDIIQPYMWSLVPNAFGMNNQEHIVRKPNTDEIDMVYTTGESVVYGRSIDFGQTWDLEVLGRGTEPVLTRTASGLIAVWRDGMSSYSYSIKSSPWIPEDTLINPAILLSEPVLGYNSTTSQTYLGYINHSYLQREEGDYILASMNELNTDGIYYDTIVSYLGELDFVPLKSPVFSLYSQLDGQPSHLVGFIDTSDNYVQKMWNLKNSEWYTAGAINNANQICNAPTTDYYGDATSFVYEAINTDETKDIYRRKLNKGIIDANAVKVNVTTGKNEYPKASNGIFINYINNSNKLITNYSGTDISVYTGADSIHTTEFETKPLLMTKVRGYHIWSEGSNGNYRIKWMTRDYYPAAFTFIESEPEDTVEKVTTSPLYEYISAKEPVEQLNTTINGLNPEMNYTVKVITSEGSLVKPQIIQIDGEVYAVVTGHANRPDTTEITLPKETYQDYNVVVSIDRKRGNPNRDAEVLVYQYETDGEEVVVVSNKIKTFAPVNTTETSTNLFTSKDNAYISYASERTGEVEIEIYNVTGSKVTSMKANVKEGTNNIGLKNLNKSGIFFVRLNNGDTTETKRINIIR